jgi:hypothetical protein
LAGKEPDKKHDGSLQAGDTGCEGVGVIVKVGDKVRRLKVGQAVCWSHFGCSFRDYVPLPVRYFLFICIVYTKARRLEILCVVVCFVACTITTSEMGWITS